MNEAQDDLDLIHENVIRELQGMGLDIREQDCLGSQRGWLFGMVYGVDNDNYEYVTVELQTRVKRLRTQARAIVKKIDKVYSNNTTVLRKVDQFNNGEAIYEGV